MDRVDAGTVVSGLGVRRAGAVQARTAAGQAAAGVRGGAVLPWLCVRLLHYAARGVCLSYRDHTTRRGDDDRHQPLPRFRADHLRSEEHTPELQSLMRISYAVFCLKKKNTVHIKNDKNPLHKISAN